MGKTEWFCPLPSFSSYSHLPQTSVFLHFVLESSLSDLCIFVPNIRLWVTIEHIFRFQVKAYIFYFLFLEIICFTSLMVFRGTFFSEEGTRTNYIENYLSVFPCGPLGWSWFCCKKNGFNYKSSNHLWLQAKKADLSQQLITTLIFL